MDPLELALVGKPRTFAHLDAFWAEHVARHAGLRSPVDRAIAGGALADRLGYAFAGGYAAALQALVPGLAPDTLASLAATEEGGAHPRAIRTTLRREEGGLRLSGEKRWVSLAGSELFVLARAGEKADGRAELRLLRIPRGRAGVEVVLQPPAPFIPEIPHAFVNLRQVRVEEADLLEGDGWERWVRPFRTVEDLHVHAAVLGHLSSVAAGLRWPHAPREKLLGLLAALRALAASDRDAPSTHLSLAGVIAQSEALLEELTPLWAAAPEELRGRWERDRPLLHVAGKARAARTEKAWAALTASPACGPR